MPISVKRTTSGLEPAFPRASLHVAALSTNARRAYAAQWRQWLAYAQATDLTPLPAAPTDVAQWLMSRSGVETAEPRAGPERTQAPALATLRSAISAVRLAHLAHGLSFDSRHPDLGLALRAAQHAARRIEAPRRRQVHPLRADMLREILGMLTASPRDQRDAALLVLGYCFGRRRSELTGLDLGRMGQGSGCLRLTAQTLEVRLAHSKRNRGAIEVYAIPRAGNEVGVAAIERWLAVAKGRPGEPVLRRVLRSGRISDDRLDAQSVALITKRRVQALLRAQGMAAGAARYEASLYAGHSLRVGLAVTAAEAGATVLAIQNALGHAGPVMAARYAQAADRVRMSPHNLEGVGVGGDAKSKRRKASPIRPSSPGR